MVDLINSLNTTVIGLLFAQVLLFVAIDLIIILELH